VWKKFNVVCDETRTHLSLVNEPDTRDPVHLNQLVQSMRDALKKACNLITSVVK